MVEQTDKLKQLDCPLSASQKTVHPLGSGDENAFETHKSNNSGKLEVLSISEVLPPNSKVHSGEWQYPALESIEPRYGQGACTHETPRFCSDGACYCFFNGLQQESKSPPFAPSSIEGLANQGRPSMD